jgi:hypothetical protein
MKLKIIFIFLIFYSFVMFSADNEPAFQTIEKEGITFSWRVNNNMLDIKMKAPTKGWLSVGIDPSKKMKDADYILGCFVDGNAKFQDSYGSGNLSHKPDISLGGTDDIKNKSAKEDGNSTEISFSLSLNSNDKYDKIITKGKHIILLAYSDKDDFKKKHKKWVKIEITI